MQSLKTTIMDPGLIIQYAFMGWYSVFFLYMKSTVKDSIKFEENASYVD